MRVVVVPHDPRWAEMFRDEAATVAEVLGPNACACHHIGSTAIPGIHAKPIIDMLIEAKNLRDVDARNPAMAAAGYEALGEFGIAGRRYFRKNDTRGTRTHQIHLFAAGSPEIERHLAFRDFMATHANEARQYSELKQTLAAAHPHDIDAYMAGKDAFIKAMERTALAFRDELQTPPRVLLRRSPSVMTLAPLLVFVACGGCRPDAPPSQPLTSTDAPNEVASAPSSELPRLEWSEPAPDDPNVVEVSGGGWPASLASLRRRFTEKPWQEARKPWFRIWLTDDDFFQIDIDPTSANMIGTLKTVRIVEDGPLRGEKLPVTRTTGPLADEGAALMLLEAYLKQDGSFDQQVQWAD